MEHKTFYLTLSWISGPSSINEFTLSHFVKYIASISKIQHAII
nr:MAG TPA: hypothetical protein [Caudoviricetes sp.]